MSSEPSWLIRLTSVVYYSTSTGIKYSIIGQILCIICFCLLLFLTNYAASAAQPRSHTYPVRRTVEMKYPKNISLEKLKDLPLNTLNGPLFENNGIYMSKGDSTNVVKVLTWREYDRYSDTGYQPMGSMNFQLSRWLIKERGFIFFLERAKSSKVSCVQNLPMSRKLLYLLPINLGPLVSREELDSAQGLIKQGKIFVDFFPKTRIKKCTKTMMQVEVDNDWYVWLRIMAYGDYNHDGYEDVLVYVSHEAIHGTMCYSFYAVLTRKSKTARLQNID